ncbi:MAG TPA: hypothetical protein VK961_08980 [Chthoniobacter sp.]|nr:hypothetical protein [Chthoniobacter sp.]
MRSATTLRAIVLSLLLGLLCLADGRLQAAEPDDRVSLINRRFSTVILPRVSFRDADFVGVLEYLKRKAEQESNGALKMPFILALPADFIPRYELTLDMGGVPYGEALRYVAELAGVRMSQENGAIVVRPDTSTATPRALAQEKERPASTPLPAKDKALTGPLGKPVEAAGGGGNLHRATDGAVQPEKSGYIPRRGLNGYPEAQKRFDVNCRNSGACPSAVCGCNICTCGMK